MSCPADETGVTAPDLSEDVATSVDAFYGGRFHLVQPKGWGYRSGLDALLLAASLPSDRSGAAADLGAGAGAVGLALAVRCQGLTVALVEKEPLMASLARASMALPRNADLAARLSVVEADVLAKRPLREAAGLLDGSFRTVVTNPPFHPEGGRPSPDALRDAALAVPDAAFFDRWIGTAAALLATGGLLAMIARPDGIEALLAACRNRLGDLRLVPVHARADRPAIRVLLQGRKGSRAPLSILSPVVLHSADGTPTDIARAVGEGDAHIDLGLS